MINVAELSRTMRPELRLLRFSWRVISWLSDASLVLLVLMIVVPLLLCARKPFGYAPGWAPWWPRQFYGYRRGRW
jgi:hypothetical protein